MVSLDKWQSEIAAVGLKNEKQVLKEIEKQYKQALKDVKAKIAELMGRTDLENQASIIYQLNYQKALKGQIGAILDNLKTNQYTTIEDYLQGCYQDGFIGTMYDIQKQGIPLIQPIDQKQMVKAILTDSKLSEPLYESLGIDINDLKKAIRLEVSRGISNNYSFAQIAQQIDAKGQIGINKAYRIARTEGHRIQEEAKIDAQKKAKDTGADVVKQWDAALDKRTRKSHAKLDGQIREIDQPFEYDGHKAMNPGGFGVAALDINCRCAMIQRAKWALDDDELETLKKRAEYFDIDKSKDFEDFKKKYLESAKDIEGWDTAKGMISSGTYDETGYEQFKKIHTKHYNYSNTLKYGYQKKYGDYDNWPDEAKKKWEVAKQISDDETEMITQMKELKEGKVKTPATPKVKSKIIEPKAPKIKETPKVEEVKELSLNDKAQEMIKNGGYDEELYKQLKEDHIKNYNHSNTVKYGFQKKYGDDYDLWPEEAKLKYAEVKEISDNEVEVLKQLKNNKVISNQDVVVPKKLKVPTKKVKLESLQKELSDTQKELNKIDNKTYSGIWKNDVTLADYTDKKASIQAKIEYFETKVNYYEDLVNQGQIQYQNALDKFQKYLDDVEDFEELGKEYEKLNSKVNNIQGQISKLNSKPTGVDLGTFSQERKDKAHWFTDKNGSTKGADGILRDECGKVWREATNGEKNAIYNYTKSYSKFNEPLRGYEYGTNKFLGVGKVNLETIGMNYGSYARGEVKKLIDNMTSIIDKSTYNFDIWLNRGCRYQGMDKFFNIDMDDLKNLSSEKLSKKLVDTALTDFGFISCGVAKGKGFGGDIKLNIYAPKGTKMMYAEPFSAFGDGPGISWDGIKKQSIFGSESEIILQRSTQFRVTKVERSGGVLYVDLEVIGQNRR